MKLKHLILIPLVAAGLTYLPSCDKLHTLYRATTYETTAETADQIIIRSEQLTKQALYTFDTFLYIERNNETMLKGINPNIHVAAEKVRANGKQWIITARNATKTFKANRTDENAANMRTAYYTLKGLYDEVKSYQSDLDKANTKTP